MNVAALKQHLADLARLLDATGAKQVAKDLHLMVEGLQPFSSQTIAEFTRFLGQAHEYHTTGKLSTPAKTSRTSGQAKAQADPVRVGEAVRRLYDRSNDLSLSLEYIESELVPLRELPKAGLLAVCKVMELRPKSKSTVNEIRAAIRQKILDRRSSAQREMMIQHPDGAEAAIGSNA